MIFVVTTGFSCRNIDALTQIAMISCVYVNRVAELIPPRPAFPVCLDSADKVQTEHAFVQSVCILDNRFDIDVPCRSWGGDKALFF